MSKLLLLDSPYLCHRAKHGMKDLSYKEKETGIIYNFIGQILRLAEKFDTNEFIFVWDSKKSLRKLKYTLYKNNRKEKTIEEENLESISRPQFELLKNKILSQLGFENIFSKPGYEADDIIASIVMNQEDYFPNDVVIISRDADLYQLLDYCCMYDLETKSIINKEIFFKKVGLIPKEWIQVKEITGCTSDNIKGIDRVAEKTAIKYLKNELPSHHKSYLNIKDGEEIIERNNELIELPLDGVGLFKIEKFKKLNIGDFIALCIEYNFKSYVTGPFYDKWNKIFC